MRRAGLTAAVVVAALVAAASPAGAAPRQTDPTPPPPTPPATPVVASVSPDLSGVEVDSVGFRRANTLYVFVRSELDDVRNTRATADTQLAELAAEELRLAASMQEGTVRKKEAAVALAAVRERRRHIAVAGYMGGESAASAANLVDLDAGVAAQARGLLVRGLDEVSADDQEAAEAAYAEAVDQIEQARGGRAGIRERVERITTIRDQAASEEERLLAELAQRRVDLDQARALSIVVGADFTLVAMDAYYKAAVNAVGTEPGCGIPWWAIAGIARVESRHGTYGGTELRADGTPVRPIIGIPLDGTNNTVYVGDTDGGALDGDPVVDRAVGPMQFIPGTWARFARDGNADSRSDPQNIYDAAAAAAAYLCRSAPLSDDEGLSRAYFRYNHSDSYVRNVLAWAHRYETVPIPPPV